MNPAPGPADAARKPPWLRARLAQGAEFERVNARLRGHRVSTVCSSARCPNLAECWNRGTATFMLLGPTCTRRCRFCSVPSGNPRSALDETEPGRVAAAVAALGLRYVVLTSVDRDDLPDLGAGLFAATVRTIREVLPSSPFRSCPSAPALPLLPFHSPSPSPGPLPLHPFLPPLPSSAVEVLVPDFGGREELIARVLDAGPAVFGHNLETVERLTPETRDRRAGYRRSLAALATAKRLAPAVTTKSGLMVGLGETDAEVSAALRDLRAAGCDVVTIGQYLRPARRCLPVARYVEPGRFAGWEQEALALGFRAASCGPLVRSSYLADRLLTGRPAGGSE